MSSAECLTDHAWDTETETDHCCSLYSLTVGFEGHDHESVSLEKFFAKPRRCYLSIGKWSCELSLLVAKELIKEEMMCMNYI